MLTIFYGIIFAAVMISLFAGSIFFFSLSIALMAREISSANNGKNYRNYHQIKAIRYNYDTRNEDVNWDLFKN